MTRPIIPKWPPSTQPGWRAVGRFTFTSPAGGEVTLTQDYEPTLSTTEIKGLSARLAAGASALLWDGTTDIVDSFTQALFRSTGGPVQLELTCNDGAQETLFVVTIPEGAVWPLYSNASLHTAIGGDLLAGSSGVINKLRCKNPSGSATITVEGLLTR